MIQGRPTIYSAGQQSIGQAMLIKKILPIITIFALIGYGSTVWAMRTRKPPTFTDLKEPNQLVELNNYLADVYALTNGRYSLENLITNPQDTRKGTKGDLVYATFGGNDHLCVSTSFPAGFNWTCINIGTLSTCPGGSDGMVQFNDNGTCGGDADLTWEKNLNVLMDKGSAGIGGDITSISPSATLEIDPTNVTGVIVEQTEFLSDNQVIWINSGTTLSTQRQNQFLAPTLNGVAGGATETVTDAATMYVSGAPSGSNITFTNSPHVLWVDGTVDGTMSGILMTNSQTNSAGSTNEASTIDFGFGSDKDVGRITSGKINDYTTSALSDSYLAFNVDADGTSREIARFIGKDGSAANSQLGLAIGTTSLVIGSIGGGALSVRPFGNTVNDSAIVAQDVTGTYKLIDVRGNNVVYVGDTTYTGSQGLQVLSGSQSQIVMQGTQASNVPALLTWRTQTSPAQSMHLQFNDIASPHSKRYMSWNISDVSGVEEENPILSGIGLYPFTTNPQIITLASGTIIPTQRAWTFGQQTINGIAGGSAETVTSGATVYIKNAPSGSNIVFTNGPYALWVGSGQSFFEGSIKTVLAGNKTVTTDANGVLTTGTASTNVATVDTTGLTANVGATTLYSVPASGAGMYRVSAYVVETTAGSLSSTLPNVQIVYNDVDTAGSITIDATPILGVAGIGQTGALTANTVGTASAGVIVINVTASTTIQYLTTNYASNLAGMAYALHIKLEAL